ncbi:MAG: tetratricopeptide repeat-containing sensor histidine kinase [Bacteroidota bacterium]
MYRIIFIFMLFVGALSYRCRAADPILDSLHYVLDTTQSEAERGRTLYTIAARLQFRDAEKSLEYVQKAIPLLEKLDDPLLLADAEFICANHFMKFGAADRAMKMLLRVLDKFKAAEVHTSIAKTYMSIGLVHQINKDYLIAIEEFDRAAEYYRQANSQRGEAIVRHNTAVAYMELGDTLAALRTYRENYALGDTMGPRFMGATCNNMGNAFRNMGAIDSAFHYFNLALDFKREYGSPTSFANTLTNIGETYLQMKEFEFARAYLDSAEILLIEFADPEIRRENALIQSRLAEILGNSQRAYDYLRLAWDITDSLYTAERAVEAAQMSAIYRSEARQAEIDLLNSRRSRLQWTAAALSVSFGLLTALFVVYFLRNRERSRSTKELLRKSKQIEVQRQEILQQNTELQRQNQRLEELNQEKDGLIGIVAHDIRAPLNRSAALAELIASVGPLTDEQQKFIQMISKVSEEGGRLIQDLLELNAYERSNAQIDWREVCGNETLEQVYRGFAKQARSKQMGIQVQLPPTPVRLQTDGKLLLRILDNLVSNAVKFTQPGRSIYLSLGMENGEAIFRVRDEGPGMSAEDQKKMYRKFQRLSARPTAGESSTGLGLSIVRTLVERLQGRIEVASEIGQGSTFAVILPLKPQGIPPRTPMTEIRI